MWNKISTKRTILKSVLSKKPLKKRLSRSNLVLGVVDQLDLFITFDWHTDAILMLGGATVIATVFRYDVGSRVTHCRFLAD